MSLHNFNPNNKSWKMYSNTITSISGDNLTIKPYDGKNLLLEVSGNNNIFFKKGDISYGLDDLIDTNITLTSVSGDIIPSNDNTFKLGDVSKNWSNAYIRDLSVSNISVSENFILNISGSMTDITDIFNKEGFYGTINFINNTSNSSKIYNFVLKDNKTSPTTISAGIFTNPATTITISVAENSDSRLLRPYYEYNVEYLYNNTTLQEANIGFTISGGTYRSANNKYYFTPNNNNINNGTLIVTSTLIKTGFWGIFVVDNETAVESDPRYVDAYLAYNDVPLTSTQRINGNSTYTFTIAQEDRLPLPSSTLQLKLTMQNGTDGVEIGAYNGFQITDFTQNPLNEENTMNMLVNQNNSNDGNCALTFLVTYVPPAGNWSGAITFVNDSGTGGTQQFISIKKSTGSLLVTHYIYDSSNNVLSASTNSDFYLDINIYSSGDWNWLDGGFTEAVGGYTNVFEANKGWRRYTIPSQFIGQNLTYNFSFYDND